MSPISAGAKTISDHLKGSGLALPAFHVVLGSGFKDSLIGGLPSSFSVKTELSFKAVEGLHASTAPGHDGKYVFVEHARTKKTGIIQVGRLHGYEGLEPSEVVRTVMLTRELGTADYFITNAAGGMDPAHQTGDVVVITDQINLTGRNPLAGPNPKRPDGTEWGPRFQDLTRLFDREWNAALEAGLKAEGLRVHRGIYLGVPGPAFETPAEIRFYKQIGAHAVGMSTVWETIALRHSGARVCGLSLISNLAAGLSGGPDGEPEELDHFAILDACKGSSRGILKAILSAVESRIT